MEEIDDFLDDALWATVRTFLFDHRDHFEQAGIGSHDKKQIRKAIRGDATYWLDATRDTGLQGFWELVHEGVAMLNRYCYLSLSGYEFHLAHYPPGGRYARHLDRFSDRDNRMISMVIYLNEGWCPGDGGELELFDASGTAVRVAPLGRRCVLFKSGEVPHAVLESYKDRYSLTGWLLYRPAGVGTLLG